MELGDPSTCFAGAEYFPSLPQLASRPYKLSNGGSHVMHRPAEWREKATLYWEKARTTEDFDLREQYTELAVRYLEMAEKFEDRVVADAVLNGRSREY